MREIKFRAWDGEQMIESYGVGISKFFEMCNGEYEDFNSTENLMQYTGLKDKNGKEIYEGDIVNIDGLIVPVIWYAGAWMVEYFTIPTKSYLSHFDELDVEIIGNIYENTEILSGN